MGIRVEEEEYGGAETGSAWKAKRHGTRGRRKIEGTRLNVGQRRKLRRKACPVAMDSIRPEDVESRVQTPLSNLIVQRRAYTVFHKICRCETIDPAAMEGRNNYSCTIIYQYYRLDELAAKLYGSTDLFLLQFLRFIERNTRTSCKIPATGHYR